MSDQAALLAAIRDNHEDDITARLIYADWLDENAASDADRARAELVRAQCETTRLNGDYNAAELTDGYVQLAVRSAELIELHQSTWLAQFPAGDFDFYCGFPRGFDITAEECLGTPRPPWEQEPVLGVRLTGTAAGLRKLFASDWLDGVHGLDLKPDEDVDGDELAEAIASSSCAATLRELHLWSDTLTDAGLLSLGSSPRLGRLSTLMLHGRYSGEGWAAIANGPVADRLTALVLGYIGPLYRDRRTGPEAAAALAASPRLGRLQTLWLGRNQIGSKGFASIANSRHLGNLRQLSLLLDPLDATAADVLTATALPKLEYLELQSCELSDETVGRWGECGLRRRLTRLSLTGNALTEEGVRALLGAAPFPRLEELRLNEMPFGDAGARVIASTRSLPNLVALELCDCEIGPRGVKELSRAPWATKLSALHLDGNPIQQAGVDVLADPTNFPRLYRLNVERAVPTEALKESLIARFGDGVWT